METITKRMNKFLNLAIAYALCLCLMIFVSSLGAEYFKTNDLEALCTFELYNLDPNPYVKKRCVFAPNIDLSNRFTWNTKQIFLYLTIKYEDKEEMIWWKIVGHRRKKTIKTLYTPELNFEELPDKVQLELRGHRQPWVGMIHEDVYFRKTYELNENGVFSDN